MNVLQDKGNRRTRLIVEREFQIRFTLALCIGASLVICVFGGMILYSIDLNYRALVQTALVQMPDIVSSMRKEQRLLSLSLIALMILLMGTIFVLGLYLTHRIAGPVYALQSRLKSFAEGNLGVRLRLRRHDQFKNLEHVFNLAMEESERRTKFFRTQVELALSQLTSSHQNLAQETLEHLLKDSQGKKESRH